MSDLKIGDEGRTDSRVLPNYRIAAADVYGRLIAELWNDDDTENILYRLSFTDTTENGIKLLPPTPKVLTLRNALMVDVDSHKLLSLQCVFDSPAARLADITYQPDGRIVSITFADEAAASQPSSATS